MQGELYPSLVLFPAGNESPVTYEGETAVSSVINFMVEHGSNLRHLISENGELSSFIENYARISSNFFNIFYCLPPSS